MLKLIKDPVFGNTVLSTIEAAILEMPVFNRLHHLMQNGLAYRVFPSNTTTRFEHSIGVMHLAGDMYCRSLANAFPKTRERFLSQAWKTVLAPVSSKNTNDDPLLSNTTGLLQQIESALGSEFLNHQNSLGVCHSDSHLQAAHAMLLQAVRLAGLLHDGGHLPGSHLFEDAIRLIHNYGIPQILHLNSLQTRARALSPDRPLSAIHEQVGFLIACAIFGQSAAKAGQKCQGANAVVDRLALATLRILGWQNSQSHSNGVTDALAELVSGDLDADRLDFILRDGRRTGLVDASGDVDRICKMMCLVETDTGFRFCPAVQTLNDVQQCLLDRLRLYQYLYSHHRVWRLENMLKMGIRIILQHPGALREKLIGMFTDFTALSTDPRSAELQPVLMRIARYTDYWLLELVREAYGTIMQKNEQERIQELFSGRKTWCGLWKREFEYRNFLIRTARLWLQQDP